MNYLLQITTVIFLFQINLMAQKSVDAAAGIVKGDTVKNFTATTDENNTFELYTALKERPVVLIFYRGAWCPICSRHLQSIQDSLHLITDAGAQVVAISPDATEGLNKTKEKGTITFTLLHDKNLEIATAFDVNFHPNEKEVSMYNKHLGAELKENESQLPIPAVYIIDQEGVVTWRFFDPNYQNRATVQSILENL